MYAVSASTCACLLRVVNPAVVNYRVPICETREDVMENCK